MKSGVRIGMDIGIGSIGWCVISGKKEKAKIEDFGVRIFDSGELEKYGKNRKSQERRGFRAVRRLTRRRSYRKNMIKAHMQNIGLTTAEKLSAFYEKNHQDIYEIRAKAVKERITPEELAACMIHACNHRGYRDFYEEAEKEAAGGYHNIKEQPDDEADAEEAKNKQALAAFDRLFVGSGCNSISQFIVKHFKNGNDKYPAIRNRETNVSRYLIRREYVRDEISKILSTQASFYPCLSQSNIEMALKIIFTQRDFEDGPGNPDYKYRRYTGFLSTIGKCIFYHDLDRGFRSTVMADVFAVVNTLSQYRYVDLSTSEFTLTKSAAGDIIQHLLSSGNLTMTEVKNILKKHGLKLLKSENSNDKALSKAIKYLKTARKCIEEAGLDWQEYISEPQLDHQHFSRLHKLGEVISKFHTPARRRKELAKLDFVTDELVNAFAGKKISGTSNVCYQYMCEASQAFLNGEVYGNFQAERIKVQKGAAETGENKKYLLTLIDDKEVKNNPVVFRAINETRKVLNEIIRVYGSPECINIEVASDLNRSFTDRLKIKKRQDENEKRNIRDKKRIAELLSIPDDEVRGVLLDKYRLYEEQGGKCLYSGAPLGDLQEVLTDRYGRFEIDHIVPYSLILDNTLNNKALVLAHENQLKGQRTPLMYLSPESRAEYLAFINVLYSRKENQISSRKYQYLKLENLYGKDAEELLRNWKSRNINDTRYITRYIVAYLKDGLIFSGHKTSPVYGIKGGLTSRFRKIWLNKKTWGGDEKDRDTSHLHHAVDAVVIANLTPEYVEIASDNIKLQQILRRTKNTAHPEYQLYLDSCIRKMKKHYVLNEDYVRVLLTKTQRAPSYIPNLRDEVDIRFNDQDAELWQEQLISFYRVKDDFVRQPRLPLVSYKQERRFRGTITDSNPIKVREIDGKLKKIKRVKIQDITRKKLDSIRTGDKSLISSLEKIFSGKDDKYSVGKYLKDTGLPYFVTERGQKVNKLSVIERTIPNPYCKNISANNYSLLGGLKYYCIEIYENRSGRTCTWGLKFVDLVKRDKKLWLKPGILPSDYGKHIMYLFTNDYIQVINKKGEIKFEGFYKSVFNVNQNSYYYAKGNAPQQPGKYFTIAGSDTVKKYYIDVLGRRGGEIKCSAPLSLLAENPLE